MVDRLQGQVGKKIEQRFIEKQRFFQHTHVPGLLKYINIGQFRQINLLHGVCKKNGLVFPAYDKKYRKTGIF
ncbi:MAG: hypothetical protein BEV12_24160 [Microcystis aeruginosa CACIAM 03]|nr:MAG: hypothetical protein BEV12_24160 [Microcystis aeruginosa CACIAM 03]